MLASYKPDRGHFATGIDKPFVISKLYKVVRLEEARVDCLPLAMHDIPSLVTSLLLTQT